MTKEDQIKLIDEIAEEIRPLVLKLEDTSQVTKNHYARYGSLLTELAGSDKTLARLYGLALKRAGANVAGINAAIRVFYG